jgi:hypothetical protein
VPNRNAHLNLASVPRWANNQSAPLHHVALAVEITIEVRRFLTAALPSLALIRDGVDDALLFEKLPTTFVGDWPGGGWWDGGGGDGGGWGS